MPVLELAEREVRRRQLLPPNLSIKWIQHDDKCDASYATISAMDGYGIDCSHVLFGPACEFALGKCCSLTIPMTISLYGHSYSCRQPLKCNCNEIMFIVLLLGPITWTIPLELHVFSRISSIFLVAAICMEHFSCIHANIDS